jgi:hypothetical protein
MDRPIQSLLSHHRDFVVEVVCALEVEQRCALADERRRRPVDRSNVAELCELVTQSSDGVEGPERGRKRLVRGEPRCGAGWLATVWPFVCWPSLSRNCRPEPSRLI